MYIVRLDNKKIFDQRVDELTLIDPVLELEENSAGSFKFIIDKDHPNFNDIKRRKSIIQVFEDNDLIFSGMVYEVDEDFNCNRSIYCEGELSYLNDSIQRPAEYHNMTVRGLLEAYVNNHNAQVEKTKQFKLGMVTVKDPNDSIYCYTNMETTMQCIKEDLVDDLGGIVRIRYLNGEKYIDYIKEEDVRTNNQIIRLGENIIDYKSNLSSLDIATAIIPLGAKLEDSPIKALDMRLDIKKVNSGKDYVSDSVAVNTFGWVYKTVTWDDVTNAQTLKNKGLKYLNDTQFDNLVIEVNAVDLHMIDKNEPAVRLSDQIRIVSKPHGLKNKYFRLTRQKIVLNNPEQNTIVLGKEEHLSLSARTVQANQAILKAMESIVPPSNILKQAKDNASALINGNGENGYVVLHENAQGVVYEILIMDTPSLKTATKVWRWNQKGFGYANSKDAKGNFKFGTAITMDGSIVADYVTTGVLSGDRIKGGSLVIGGKEYLDSQNQKKNPAYNGSISVKNTSDTVLATINNQGIQLNGGSINLGQGNFIVDTTGSASFKKGAINLGAITDTKGNVTDYNFKVDNNGKVTAQNADIKGTIKATSGELQGQLTIGGKDTSTSKDGSIVINNKNGTQVAKIDKDGIDMDAGSINIGDNFSVTTDGKMTASEANIQGSVKSTGESSFVEITKGQISGGGTTERGVLQFFHGVLDHGSILEGPILTGTQSLCLDSPKVFIGSSGSTTGTVYQGFTGDVLISGKILSFINGICV